MNSAAVHSPCTSSSRPHLLARRDLYVMLSRFSRVRLCNPVDGSPSGSAIPGILQARILVGLPFPFPMHESESEVTQSCLTPSDPMDCSPPGSSVHGICQARVLEWVAIAFSNRDLYSSAFPPWLRCLHPCLNVSCPKPAVFKAD